MQQSGQAAVETAIVMPLFVFLLLGILQLGLMHQARLVTKYAAYKAVRAGALHHNDVATMERAALAVLLPLVSHDSSGAEVVKPMASASDFRAKWQAFGVRANTMPDAQGMKYAEVTICHPLQRHVQGLSSPSTKELDFDDPSIAAGSSWEEHERTKLSVQVTFNYRLPIPFANMVVHLIARGQERATLLNVLRMGKEASVPKNDKYTEVAEAEKIYILPIRASYTMRMQSNLHTEPLPTQNQCVIPFGKKGP